MVSRALQVAQFKATVLLMPNGSDRVTNAAPTQKLETEKKVGALGHMQAAECGDRVLSPVARSFRTCLLTPSPGCNTYLPHADA